MITVLFTRSPNPVAKLIRKVTWFPYSHTALTDGEYVYECNHADGCIMIPKEQWYEKNKDNAPFEIAIDVDSLTVVERARSLLGAGYDWFGILGYIWRSGTGRGSSHLVCSEFVSYCINYDKTFFIDDNHHRRAPRHVFLGCYAHSKAINNG